MIRRTGDRRGTPRFEIIGDLWGTAEVNTAVRLRNLGRGGALLDSSIALSPNSVYPVVVVTDEGSQPVTLRVRHSTEAEETGRRHYLVGVEFLDVSPRLDDFLARCVTPADAVPASEDAGV